MDLWERPEKTVDGRETVSSYEYCTSGGWEWHVPVCYISIFTEVKAPNSQALFEMISATSNSFQWELLQFYNFKMYESRGKQARLYPFTLPFRMALIRDGCRHSIIIAVTPSAIRFLAPKGSHIGVPISLLKRWNDGKRVYRSKDMGVTSKVRSKAQIL